MLFRKLLHWSQFHSYYIVILAEMLQHYCLEVS